MLRVTCRHHCIPPALVPLHLGYFRLSQKQSCTPQITPRRPHRIPRGRTCRGISRQFGCQSHLKRRWRLSHSLKHDGIAESLGILEEALWAFAVDRTICNKPRWDVRLTRISCCRKIALKAFSPVHSSPLRSDINGKALSIDRIRASLFIYPPVSDQARCRERKLFGKALPSTMKSELGYIVSRRFPANEPASRKPTCWLGGRQKNRAENRRHIDRRDTL